MLEFLRKDLLLVLAVTAVFVSLSYAIGFVADRPPTTVESLPTFLAGDRAPRPQPVAQRVWKEHNFEKLLSLDSPAVTKPVILRVAAGGEIYVLDWADLRIKKFSPDGNLVRAFGAPQGKSSDEGAFVNPTSFSVGPGGELWVCDPVQRKLVNFKPDGSAQSVTPADAVDRVAVLGDTLVTMAPPGSAALFQIYDTAGERRTTFGQFLEKQSEQGIALDGNVVGDPASGGFVYGGRHLGIIAGFGTDGTRRFVAHTVDGNAMPTVLNIDGRRKVKSNGPPIVLSLSILGDQLYILSGARADVAAAAAAGGQVLDVYDKRDGTYKYSLKLPEACKEVVVRGDGIYALVDQGVRVWRFRQSA